MKNSSLSSFGACPIMKLFWSAGQPKSIRYDADYSKGPWGQSKCFANGSDGRGGQYEAMDMLRWGQHRAMDMMERGEGSIKMFRQSGHTTVIFSCS